MKIIIISLLFSYVAVNICSKNSDIHMNFDISSIQSKKRIINDQYIQSNIQFSNNKVWSPSNSKKYKLSSLRQPGLYLTLIDQYHLTTEQWKNNSSQLFYLKKIKNNNFKIYSVQNGRPLKVFKSYENIIFRFGEASQFKQFSQNNKSNQYLDNQIKEHPQQIWQIQRDFNTSLGFYIKSFIGQKLSSIKVRYKNQPAAFAQDIYNQKINTWILKQFIQQNLQNPQFYQGKITQLYRNLTQNINNSVINEKWVDFFELKYFYSLVQPNFPRWLQIYHLSILNYDLPYTIKQNKQLLGFLNFFRRQKPKINQFCSQKQVVTYVWLGNKQVPPQYKKMTQKCGQKARILGNKDFKIYKQKWDNMFPDYIIPENRLYNIQKVDILKLVYLFFEGGIYSDFDVQINQQCYEDIITDEVIFTSNIPITPKIHWIPQESYIVVRKKYHPTIKGMIEKQIKKQDRWAQCKARQCFIVNCQRHFYDKSYNK